MRNLIANALSVVLLWAFIGPATLVATSGQDAHECCYRAHHSSATTRARLENQGPSHECCRLLFTSHAPTAFARPVLFGQYKAFQFAANESENSYAEIQPGSHPERAPPFLT